ncbi:MAG: endolytic transglycosylase MltG [Clostridium sp.]|nr:endolytic transglycosylase MltG [Clostridium sp.]
MAQERRSDRSDASYQRRGTHQSSAPRREQTPASRQKRRSKGWSASFTTMYVIVVIGVSVLLACFGWIAANDVLALNKPEMSTTVTVTPEMIKENGDADIGQVSSLLKKEGLINYKSLFRIFSSMTNGEEKVTAGTFTLTSDMDYRALISNMSLGSSTKATIKVTIPEGYSVAQIFQLLEDKGVASVEDLTETAAEHDYAFSFLADIPLGDANRLEGYLFPDTYEFTTPHNPLYAINKMLVRFDEMFTDEMRQEVADNGKTIQEVLTVASLIERETDGTDQTKISSVIYNRLNNPNASAGTMGYLQIDATLAYINGGQIPTETDKSIDSPYNTYLYKGLPPGPIASPGMEAIRAAMHPERTGYYYYALGDDGTHHFFQSYGQMQSFIATQTLYNTSN